MKDEKNFYMAIAELAAGKSYAERNKVGAVLVKDFNVISFGYNGTPRGFDNQCEDGNVTKDIVIHAECNAICKCAAAGNSCEGASLYVTLSPCIECAKMIIQAGIKAVYYKERYRVEQTIGSISPLLLLSQANIYHEQIF